MKSCPHCQISPLAPLFSPTTALGTPAGATTANAESTPIVVFVNVIQVLIAF
jgi:hypothetical protein